MTDYIPEPLAKNKFFSTFGLGFLRLILWLKIFTLAEGLDKMAFFPLIDH
jgi:hypothetical protein